MLHYTRRNKVRRLYEANTSKHVACLLTNGQYSTRPEMNKDAGDWKAMNQNAEIRTGARSKRKLNRCGKRAQQPGGIRFVLFECFPTWAWVEVLTMRQTLSHDPHFLADHWGWWCWWLTGAKVSPRGIHCCCLRAGFIFCSSSLTVPTSSLETENVKRSITKRLQFFIFSFLSNTLFLIFKSKKLLAP